MSTRHRREARLTCVLFVAATGLSLAGCATQTARVSPSPASRPAERASPAAGFARPSGTIDAEALLQDLRSFENAVQSLIEGTSDSIADHSSDPQVQRACVLWRTRVLTQFSDAISSAEPAVAMMEVWAICLRMKDYLATGEGKTLFGPVQPQALDAARRALTMIEDVVDKYLSDAQRKAAAQEIREYASQYPYVGAFDSSEPSPLRLNNSLLSEVKAIIGLPLAPFVTAGKVNEGVGYIKDWAPAVSRLTDVIEDYPRSVRWQADRLLLDLDRAPAFQEAVRSVDRISGSADQISNTVSQFQPIADRYANLIESLPTDTANQVQSVLADLDRNRTAQSATQSLDRISASSEQLIAVAQLLPASLQQALDRSSQGAGTQGKDLVDHIALRATQLLGLAFVLSAMLIVLSRLVRRKRA